jgi:hypothetical protein
VLNVGKLRMCGLRMVLRIRVRVRVRVRLGLGLGLRLDPQSAASSADPQSAVYPNR